MSNLTALILAAGYGSRISDVTDDPKSLLKINGKAIMDWHFEALKLAGIKNVVVVTGYKREMLEAHLEKFKAEFDIHIAVNDDFRIKGNTYSFYFGLEKTHGDFLLFDADLIYDANILKSFVDDPVKNQILVGSTPIDDIECTKTMVDHEGFVRLTVDKRAVTNEELEKFNYVGEAIGILKFSKHFRDEMFKECCDFLADPANISKNWEHVLNRFLLKQDMNTHQTISDRWIEIDNKADLEKARSIFE